MERPLSAWSCLLGGAARAGCHGCGGTDRSHGVVLVFAIAMGLAMAATATVARRIGEHDPEGASVAAVQAIGAGVVLSILMGIGGYAFARDCWSSCTLRLP